MKELIPLRPNQLWVSDITYMVVYRNAQTGEYDFCYLSLVTDYYTKEIIGWCVGETLEAKFAIKALNMALKRLGDNPVPDLIHHSDRGVQYASYDYTGILKKHGMRPQRQCSCRARQRHHQKRTAHGGVLLLHRGDKTGLEGGHRLLQQ